MKPTLLAPIAALLLALPSAALAAFPDVQSAHENGRAIEYLQKEGIMTGYPNGTFGPDRRLSRAELMKILVEASVGKPESSYARSCFPDVRSDEWYAVYVCYAKDQGWVSGYPDGTFQPAKEVSIVEALKMLVNARGYAVPSEPGFIADWTNQWFAPYIGAAARNHLVSDDTIWERDGEMLVGPIARERIAEFLYRALWNEGKLALDLELNPDCAVQNISGVELVGEDTQDIVAYMKTGGECIVVRDMNPLSGVGKYLRWRLAVVVPVEMYPIDHLEPLGVPAGGKVYFRATCDCDAGTLPGIFELDLRTGAFTEFLAADLLVSADYRFFVSVKDHQEVIVYDRKMEQTKTVAKWDWPLTLAAESFGPQDGLSGGMSLGGIWLEGHKLRYFRYNARNHSRDDVTKFESMDTQTHDLDVIFGK